MPAWTASIPHHYHHQFHEHHSAVCQRAFERVNHYLCLTLFFSVDSRRRNTLAPLLLTARGLWITWACCPVSTTPAELIIWPDPTVKAPCSASVTTSPRSVPAALVEDEGPTMPPTWLVTEGVAIAAAAPCAELAWPTARSLADADVPLRPIESEPIGRSTGWSYPSPSGIRWCSDMERRRCSREIFGNRRRERAEGIRSRLWDILSKIKDQKQSNTTRRAAKNATSCEQVAYPFFRRHVTCRH